MLAVVLAGRPCALTLLAGTSMVGRAVRTLLDARVTEHVTVLDGGGLGPDLGTACSGLPVSVCDHLPAQETAVLIHDACRPLAPATLATAVAEAVRAGADLAAPVLALTDTVKQVDDEGFVTATPDRTTLRVLQTPFALRAGAGGLGGLVDPLDVVRRHLAAGVAGQAVPGHPAAFAVSGAWDLELAERVATGRVEL